MIVESPLSREVEESHTRAGVPIMEALRRYPKQVLLAIGARVGVDVAFYTFVPGTSKIDLHADPAKQRTRSP
jgi:hypothetical protein